jgi:hypothetical protein
MPSVRPIFESAFRRVDYFKRGMRERFYSNWLFLRIQQLHDEGVVRE